MQKFTYEQAYQNALDYFHGNELLASVWVSKYALRNRDMEYLEAGPKDRINTLVNELARAEKFYNPSVDISAFKARLHGLLDDFKYFIPGGSIIYGVGNTEYLTSLGNCFVIGSKVDSYGSICMIDQEQVQLMKRRGGVGHDLSHLRPKMSPVNGCASTSTGAFSFAPRYSNSTREVAQDGRRGALMLSAHINHPDIEDFITLKDDRVTCTGANISIRITDEFMENAINDRNHKLRFPVEGGKVYAEKSADEMLHKIVHQAWKNGEPGLLFWDTITRESPADCYADDGFETISTNPCGEIPLCPYDSCRLAHCNMLSYVIDPFTDKARFDSEKFEQDAEMFQRIMDDVIYLEAERINNIIEAVDNSYEDEATKTTELNLWKKVLATLYKGRRTGIGILGEADAVAALGLRYSSKDANDFLTLAHERFAIHCYRASIDLAKERGPFRSYDYDKEKMNPFINRIMNAYNVPDSMRNDWKRYGRRNIACLTLAPTGTVSMLANRIGVTSGIEPVFEISYKRRKKINNNDKNTKVSFIDEVGDKWEEYRVIHPTFKLWYSIKHNITFDEADDKLQELTDEQMKQLIAESPYNKATANEVDVISKIHLQGDIQKWVDHSISVTHNLPNNVTENEVYKYYVEAWKAGCKGITVYRDGSRAGVLVRNDEKKEESKEFNYKDAMKRPTTLKCDVHKLQVMKENWIVLIGLLDKRPYEVFAIKESNMPSDFKMTSSEPLTGTITKRKKRTYDLIVGEGENQMVVKDIAMLMRSDDDRFDTRHFSLDLRHGIDPRWIIELFEKQGKNITSFEKAISRVLKKYIPDGNKSGLICPNCGSTNVIYVSGCPKCKDCGMSKCG